MTVSLQGDVARRCSCPKRRSCPSRARRTCSWCERRRASREVRTGKRRPGEVEIVEGIAESERVVVEGTQNMRDGSNVQEAPIAVARST